MILTSEGGGGAATGEGGGSPGPVRLRWRHEGALPPNGTHPDGRRTPHPPRASSRGTTPTHPVTHTAH